MRRAILAVCGTAVGTALLVGAKAGGDLPDHGVAVGVPTEADPTVSGTPSARPSSTVGVRGSARPSASVKPTPTKPGTQPTGATTSAPASSGRFKDGVYSAPATYKYGTITVKVTISGGKITAASATYPTSGQSGVINGKAIPKLNAETLQAQDADIATVSGATLTSDGYRRSLQAALDKAAG
ncbi:FMN-binding protein [Hamadaea sp. NPDC050747]|uniref:FMN-binding protein n=1 Tax=Hamadaea sp. NPDC050747 TaxID=3155789 RepID=UPI00340E1C14